MSPTTGVQRLPVRGSEMGRLYLQMFQQGRMSVLPVYGPAVKPAPPPQQNQPQTTPTKTQRPADVPQFSTPTPKKQKLNVDFQALAQAIRCCAKLEGVTQQVRHNEAQGIAKKWLSDSGTTTELVDKFLKCVKARAYADLKALDLPFKLVQECSEMESEVYLDEKWDAVRAQCLLKLLQTTNPLHNLNAELRNVLLSHLRLLGNPPTLPVGKDFGNGRAIASELVGYFLKVEVQKTTDILTDSVGFTLILDRTHKKKLRVPPEAFIVRDVDAEGQLRYRTLGFTYPSVEQYAAFKAAKATNKKTVWSSIPNGPAPRLAETALQFYWWPKGTAQVFSRGR